MQIATEDFHAMVLLGKTSVGNMPECSGQAHAVIKANAGFHGGAELDERTQIFAVAVVPKTHGDVGREDEVTTNRYIEDEAGKAVIGVIGGGFKPAEGTDGDPVIAGFGQVQHVVCSA